VNVTVRYMAQLRQAAGVGVEQIELNRPCSVGDLMRHVADRRGGQFRDLMLDAEGQIRPAVLLFIGDEQVAADRPALRDGDVATVLTPMAGG